MSENETQEAAMMPIPPTAPAATSTKEEDTKAQSKEEAQSPCFVFAPTFALVYPKECADLGTWVAGVIKERFPGLGCTVDEIPEASYISHTQTLAKLPPNQDIQAATGGKLVVVAVFFDGLSDGAKDVLAQYRSWSAVDKRISVQALNAKKGAHTLTDNAEAVFSTLSKKLGSPSSATPSAPEPSASSSSSVANNTVEAAGGIQREAQQEELTEERLAHRVHEGQGDCFWVVMAPPAEFDAQLEKLKAVAAAIKCSVFPVMQQRRELVDKDDAANKKVAQEFMVRRLASSKHMEMRLAMCGNVDSGKSTLTSVLTRGGFDDGRGLARTFVFNHKHEADTGRTSSISENHLGFDSFGEVVNYPKGGTCGKHSVSPQILTGNSSKIVTLYDLAGHEKYLKTTVLGMTRSLPDYACVVISANNGIQRMTKEHIGLCLALKLPFFIVVTRIDAAPPNIRQETNANILKLLRLPNVKKLPYPVRKEDDILITAKNLKSDRVCPIFEVSNVTGQGIPELMHFINILPIRKNWNELFSMPKEMIIDSTFFVAGVGTVVGGIITQGVFRVNDHVLLGPNGLGEFRTTQIKSIHVKGVEATEVEAGNDAALCLKKEKRSNIRKGNVLVCPTTKPKAYWQFEGEIVIMYHSTTISDNYEPVIHSNTVRQSARIMLVDREVLRTGDRAQVKFHFLYRPEFLKVGQRLVFREGRTKGIGTVTKLVEGSDPTFLGSSRKTMKEFVREAHAPVASKGKK